MEPPLRCPSCGHTDFFVISTGVSYSGGTIVESYQWPEVQNELSDEVEELHEVLAPHVHDAGYRVEQEILREPDIDAVEGPVKALCAGCLSDVTELYLQLGRAESLPV
ncbi:MAG: hypothetical protein HY698_12470 [Deltaproteobacteria bacterium]|nr:hypothetical protein [Deltaproteobacteria bacterium]